MVLQHAFGPGNGGENILADAGGLLGACEAGMTTMTRSNLFFAA
jgi:hypothetical protein